MNIKEIKQVASPIFGRYSVKKAGVFGSVARGEARLDSDVDILVEFSEAPGLVQFIKMENELQELLGRKVDIVVKGSEKSLIKPFIYKDLVSLYE